MKVAFVGCTHGMLDVIYDTIHTIEREKGFKVDLLLCCGDFEAVRNQFDLDCLAGPVKYHYYKDFHRYYSGKSVTPVLTVFVGGNHEAANHLRSLYFGGWAAPNIYFLGYSGVLNYGGLRIAGFSGIYKHFDFFKGHFEKPPYNEDDKRSAYHVRYYELFKLSLIRNPLHVLCSHDWPSLPLIQATEAEISSLFQQRPYLKESIDKGELGCLEYDRLIVQLWPQFWLSGHMHVPFTSTVKSTGKSVDQLKGLPRKATKKPTNTFTLETEMIKRFEKISLGKAKKSEEKSNSVDTISPKGKEKEDEEEEEDENGEEKEEVTQKKKEKGKEKEKEKEKEDEKSTKEPEVERITRFFALDKVGRGNHFLEVIEIPSVLGSDELKAQGKTDVEIANILKLRYDSEWLSILKVAHSFFPSEISFPRLPKIPIALDLVDKEMVWVNENIKNFEVPNNFVQTVEAHIDGVADSRERDTSLFNPQTDEFLNLLKLAPIPLSVSKGVSTVSSSGSSEPPRKTSINPQKEERRKKHTLPHLYS